MNSPIVTHADRALVREIRNLYNPAPGSAAADLFERLIAAAEADAPPLPEGWVVYTSETGDRRSVHWHHDGVLFTWDDLSEWQGGIGKVFARDRLTPLRPTVTEAEIRRAAEVLEDMLDDVQLYTDIARVVFRAAGVEVAK